MSRVWARQESPITGAVVAADVVVSDASPRLEFGALRAAIVAACRDALPAHKVPVSGAAGRRAAEVNAASGKLARVRCVMSW